MKAVVRVEELVAVAVFVLWLVNQQLGADAWEWLERRSMWWFIVAIGLAFTHHFLVANHAAFAQLHKRAWEAEEKIGGKSATQLLARKLSETYPASQAREIKHLKRCIDAVTPPTPKQVEDVKHKLISYIKNDTDMVVGTCWEDALGYKDGSEEMVRISGLDSSDISGSINALSDECSCFSSRKLTVMENMNAN